MEYIIYFIQKILFDYIFISYSMFLVGFLDDLKIKVEPFKRLLFMIFFFFIIIHFLPIKILNIDIPFLKFLIEQKFFFVNFCLAMFFIRD